MGLNFDSFDWNFNLDKSGNIVYMDSFRPWFDVENTGIPKLKFNEPVIQEIIDGLKDEAVKKECNHFLQRIKDLYEQEMTERKKLKI